MITRVPWGTSLSCENSSNQYRWLYHNVDCEEKNPLSTFWELNGSSFEQTWIPFTKGCFVPNLVKIVPVVLEKIFQISAMYFHYFVIISPWKKVGPFIWINLISLNTRMLCAKFSWNWPSGSGEEDFQMLAMYFRYFIIISPWEKAWPFYWAKFKHM